MLRPIPKLFLILLALPLFLLVACSDDDAGASDPATAAPAATVTQEAPSDAAIKGTVVVDFTGAPEELAKVETAFEVGPESSAWDAVKMALGEDNLVFNDFGGDLGIFISGFNGVEAEGNHFWEFKVNGETAEVGVSKYVVQQGDVIEFVYSSF